MDPKAWDEMYRKMTAQYEQWLLPESRRAVQIDLALLRIPFDKKQPQGELVHLLIPELWGKEKAARFLAQRAGHGQEPPAPPPCEACFTLSAHVVYAKRKARKRRERTRP